MATYLILQHQSPWGDFCQHQIKPIQPGLALNLADLQNLPVPLRRATEPAPSTFTLQYKPQKEEDKKTRQGGTRNSMPATVCYQPKRSLPPNLSLPDCPVNYWFIRSNLKITENLTQSRIAVCSSLMASVHTPNSMFTSNHWSDQNETTGGTGNMSACSPREELRYSLEEAKSTNPRASSPVDTFVEDIQEGTISQETTVNKNMKITQEKTISQETTTLQEEAMFLEVSTTPVGNVIQEETAIQEEDIIQDVTIIQAGTMTHEQPQDAVPDDSGNRRHHRWKAVKKTIVNCLRHLYCCCLQQRQDRDL
ncbi:Sperm motility kinase X [Sigmodon hispidus]